MNGQKFDGIDYFLFLPHTDPDASDSRLKKIADLIQGYGFNVGSLVAPVWPGTVGDSAMGDAAARKKFLDAVRMACRIAGVFNKHGVRQYGVIRIDSAEFGVEKWRKDPKENTANIAETFREAAKIAADHGERLAAEGEICWAGMHSWKAMLDLLEEVGMPETLGFQADMAHTYLYLMGYNAPEHALLKPGYSQDEFYAAYETMIDKLRPWTIDFHVAQNDGQVHGAGSHDKTGKHCPADDPNGKLDIVRCAGYWLKDAAEARHPAHLLGRLHVPQRDARNAEHLEQDPRRDAQSTRRARVEHLRGLAFVRRLVCTSGMRRMKPVGEDMGYGANEGKHWSDRNADKSARSNGRLGEDGVLGCIHCYAACRSLRRGFAGPAGAVADDAGHASPSSRRICRGPARRGRRPTMRRSRNWRGDCDTIRVSCTSSCMTISTLRPRGARSKDPT